jgi:hypothetical protein
MRRSGNGIARCGVSARWCILNAANQAANPGAEEMNDRGPVRHDKGEAEGSHQLRPSSALRVLYLLDDGGSLFEK